MTQPNEPAVGAAIEAGYRTTSSGPLASLIFILPLLLVYEGGLLLADQDTVRNGAAEWLRSWLDLVGFGQYFLLPLLTCGILLTWHHVRADRWRFPSQYLGYMVLEAVCLAFALKALAHVQGSVMPPAAWLSGDGPFARVVAFCGAGIYEELLFRLMLLPIVCGLFRLTGLKPHWSVLAGVIATSLLFSAAHYRFDISFAGLDWQTHGDVFSWYSFVFRFVAGVFFSALFVLRGFGITAGTHALYDIFVGLW